MEECFHLRAALAHLFVPRQASLTNQGSSPLTCGVRSEISTLQGMCRLEDSAGEDSLLDISISGGRGFDTAKTESLHLPRQRPRCSVSGFAERPIFFPTYFSNMYRNFPSGELTQSANALVGRIYNAVQLSFVLFTEMIPHGLVPW